MTLKVAEGYSAGVRERIERVCAGPAIRIVHWSVQTEHVHLVVEAEDRTALSRGVQGLAVRLARAIDVDRLPGEHDLW